MVHPPLTTLRIARPDLVALYFKALTALLKNPHQTGMQLFQGMELVIRGTTGPPSNCLPVRQAGGRRGTP